MEFVVECLCGEIVLFDIEVDGKVYVEKGCCIMVKYMCDLVKVGVIKIDVLVEYIVGKVFVKDYVNLEIGEIICFVNMEIFLEMLVNFL